MRPTIHTKEIWDGVNQKLTKRWFTVFQDSVKVTEFSSPILQRSEEEARRNLSRSKQDFFIGRRFLEQINQAVKDHENRKRKVDMVA